MNKYLLVTVMSLCLISCGKKDESYYLSNPKALQEALKNCRQEVNGVSCQQLEGVAMKLNDLAHQLQADPQAFGNRIIKLQESITNRQAALDKDDGDSIVPEDMARDKKELAELMAVVKWLESPES